MSVRQKAPLDSATASIPATRSLATLRHAAQDCRGCDLYRNATQTVFGAGPRAAKMVLVGEQPGDREDQAGQPFVGPAGELLDECLEVAGLERSKIYLTNAVKHFKFELRGKRRIHQKPSSREVSACRPWLERELELIRPQVLVCLGATAAQALLGAQIRVTKQHGQRLYSAWCANTMVTFHPSALLRVPDRRARQEMKAAFVDDLKAAARWLLTVE